MDEIPEELLVKQKYDELVATCKANQQLTTEDEDNIFRAFTIASNAHSDTRRKSGELYIFHPLAVAQIAVEEVGLGPIAVVCALLHDVVEDTDITLETLRAVFGDRVARIVDGVTKIDKASMIAEQNDDFSSQAENYRKILLAMCDDAYVIFLKLCDRLHNMRTLGSMKDTKKLAISSETQYLYIPLAHRLGLYNIKTELDDLVMQYNNPDKYAEIEEKIKKTSGTEIKLKQCFTAPIRELLDKNDFHYNIKTRVKSVYSCWKKMQNKGVQFDEIFDLYAMRIILDIPGSETMPEEELHKIEKEECFKVYALITGLFRPQPTRFRDWITTPKNNGYESLHTTVMSPIGRWVEVQIRTTRMDQIAEKGMAAHFLYKEAHPDEPIQQSPVEQWLGQIRSSLEDPNKNALDLVEEFKETLYTKEIYIFTPKGETIKLPSRSTVLDFAYAIHSELGDHCIGAKVNARVVPIGYRLHSGEQVQILTSKKTVPNEEWLNNAQTQRAKDHIKDYLRNEKKQYFDKGEQMLKDFLKKSHISITPERTARLRLFFNLDSDIELYYRIATGSINEDALKQCFHLSKSKPQLIFLQPYQELFDGKNQQNSAKDIRQKSITTSPFLADSKYDSFDTQPAPCCKPVQGDRVVGIVSNDKIMVHRTNCPTAIHEMSTHEDRIVRVRWRPGEKIAFLTGITITAIDRKGLLQQLTRIISEDMNLNMRAITLETSEGVVHGLIMLYVHNLSRLDQLIESIRAIEGVEQVQRV
ncbi:MAG: bifunctional (p)ppGpp synthetase/guanosine-3',5'-bis(diphosphate) 3'-pyrophosphohydrolase [Bacteroidales bacterium]|nr:bifunctional (p)ppGpp synthetase/guanosine-3',5'-bis(diphosphate) 3'-pyrophosphohydrolase [Bacteroidales bacterium]